MVTIIIDHKFAPPKTGDKYRDETGAIRTATFDFETPYQIVRVRETEVPKGATGVVFGFQDRDNPITLFSFPLPEEG